MDDRNKTKEQLIAELAELRRRVAELEPLEVGRHREDPMTTPDYPDVITGLPSRHLFDHHLSIVTAAATSPVRRFALMMFHSSRYEENGHFHSREPGERLLKGVADRLKNLLRKSDILTRTGNNDFLILLPDASWMEISSRIAPRIVNSFQKPFVSEERAMRLAVNMGIVLYPGDSIDSGVLVEYAHLALQRAIKDGPNSYRFYGSQTNGKSCSVSLAAT